MTITRTAELTTFQRAYRAQMESDSLRPCGTPRKLVMYQGTSALGWEIKAALKGCIDGTIDETSWRVMDGPRISGMMAKGSDPWLKGRDPSEEA